MQHTHVRRMPSIFEPFIFVFFSHGCAFDGCLSGVRFGYGHWPIHTGNFSIGRVAEYILRGMAIDKAAKKRSETVNRQQKMMNFRQFFSVFVVVALPIIFFILWFMCQKSVKYMRLCGWKECPKNMCVAPKARWVRVFEHFVAYESISRT